MTTEEIIKLLEVLKGIYRNAVSAGACHFAVDVENQILRVMRLIGGND